MSPKLIWCPTCDWIEKQIVDTLIVSIPYCSCFILEEFQFCQLRSSWMKTIDPLKWAFENFHFESRACLMIISRADQRNTAYICFSERIGQYKLYKGRWKIAISIFGRAVKVCIITPEKCRERALPIDPRMILNCFDRVVHIWTIQTM